MDVSMFTLRNTIENERKVPVTNKHYFDIFKNRFFLAFVVTLVCSLIFFTSSILWLQVFLRREIRKTVSFFVYSYRILSFLFRGDKKGDLIKLLTGPGGELTGDTIFASILLNVKEIHERIASVDWLYWAMLFIPFYILYAFLQESFLKLRRNIRYLKEDCRLKNNFINWQNSMHTAMHQRIAELRIEVKTLSTMLDGYRQTVKENQCLFVTNKNQIEQDEQFKKIFEQDMSTGHNLLAKKNKSDSHIEEKKNQTDPAINHRGKPRPKTEGSKSTLGESNRKILTQAWTEARKRLQERSKDLLKSRVETHHRLKEEKAPDHFYQTQESEEEKKILTSTKAVLPVEKRIAIARSKFTTKKWQDDGKTLVPKDTKTTQKGATSKENSNSSLRDFSSGIRTRSATKHESSVSATDLLQPQNSFSPITPKKRSLSEAAPMRGVSTRSGRQSEIACPSFVSQDDIVTKLELEGIGRVTSYTEVFKKKVQVTKSGKPPEITIEGRRRWCF